MGNFQNLPYDENEMDKNFELEDILETEGNSGTGYNPENDLKNPDERKEKELIFHFTPTLYLILKINLVIFE